MMSVCLCVCLFVSLYILACVVVPLHCETLNDGTAERERERERARVHMGSASAVFFHQASPKQLGGHTSAGARGLPLHLPFRKKKESS